MTAKTVGIMALQGDVAEHVSIIEKLELNAVPVKYARQLDELDGLIIPGGESTTIARLSEYDSSLLEGIGRLGEAGFPLYGTCMGTILLSRSISGYNQKPLGLIDIIVSRNGFGPQRQSFEAAIDLSRLDASNRASFEAIFIRAPRILKIGSGVEVLAELNDEPVAARQDNVMVTTFHPELTSDLRVHRYFCDIVNGAQARHTSPELQARADKQIA